MNTKEVGRIAHAKVLAKLTERGDNVLLPFADVGRYDLALDQDGKLIRIECKIGRLKNGVVTFPTSSTSWYGGYERKNYRGDAELFGVWCPENDTVYLVPVDKVGVRECSLRVDTPSRRANLSKVRWAKDYVV
jgi:hypothetical protein